MNELKEGIYVCSICKVFVCQEDEVIKNHIPNHELETSNYIALNSTERIIKNNNNSIEFDNLNHNLEFTKKATVSSEIPLFSYWYGDIQWIYLISSTVDFWILIVKDVNKRLGLFLFQQRLQQLN